MILKCNEWNELYHKLVYPNVENIKKLDAFLAEPDNLNTEEILNLLNGYCFGREPFECDCEDYCIRYEECKKEYERQFFTKYNYIKE